ncbi:MAG: Ig domain-containing protein [Candidatus Fimousia sp.]
MKKFWKKVMLSLLVITMIFPVTVWAHGDHHDEDHHNHHNDYHCLNNTYKVVSKGQCAQLKVYRHCNGQEVRITKNITWTSGNKSIASVDSAGKVKGISKGSTIITAKYDGRKYQCTVKVEKPTISKSKTTVKKGASTTVTVKNTCRKVTYSTSKKGIISVKKTCKNNVTTLRITGKKKGKTVIMMKAGGYKIGTCTVTVK